MTLTELVAILALVGYAIYRQTRTTEITGRGRFKLAVIYSIVGICVGVQLPHSDAGIALFGAGILAGVAVGLLRGKLTHMWNESGRIYSRGTALTIGLFLGLVAFKFGLGTIAYLTHTSYTSGIGEVMLMVGIMLAVQAQLIWFRAQQQFGAVRTVAQAAR
jgi:hypothetical protein